MKKELAAKILATAKAAENRGLNRGTSGNISARLHDRFLITPSGLSCKEMTADDIVEMDFEGKSGGLRKPSSEWRFHRDILANRQDVGAVVHTHSMFATVFACLGREIPALHYMIAVTGGSAIRCTPYAIFGSQELSNYILTTLQKQKACLIQNHGMVALGRDLDEALSIAVEVETLCEQYWRVLQIGEPQILSAEQMNEVLEKFKKYGQWASSIEGQDGKYSN